MPFTPLHFGPAAAIHSAAPRYVSFLAFCAANVLIDLESLYNLRHGRHPVHAFFHTYIGATLVTLVVICMFSALRKLAPYLPNVLAWKELKFIQVITGAAFGVYSHVLLDSIMHSDIQPFAPWSSSNDLLGLVSISTLHWFCLATGLVGLLVIGIRNLVQGNQNAVSQETPLK